MSLAHTARQYRKKSEQLRLAKQFRDSGLTQAAFSKQHHVSSSTLVRWLGKARDASPEPPKPSTRVLPVVFREVRLPDSVSVFSPGTAMRSWVLEVVTPDGWTLRCRDMPPLEDVVRLLRASRC